MNPYSDVAVVINLLVTLAVGWGFLWLNGTVRKQTKFNNYRFRFFELRDRLTYLVMEGQIAEGSREHRVLLMLLNGAVQSTGTFEVTRFLRFIANWANDPRTQKDLDRVLRNMQSHTSSPYREIVQDALELALQMLKKDTWFLLRVIYPMIKALNLLLRSPVLLQKAIAWTTKLIEAKGNVHARLNSLAATT
ncbi:MAG: hypothetical protein HW380_213 [Magnetococcales bacterium]|nr:hypothetical protein [Magnetococcales bacterium]